MKIHNLIDVKAKINLANLFIYDIFKPIQIKKYKIVSNLGDSLFHQFNVNEIVSKFKMSIIAMSFEQLFDHLDVFLFGLLLGFPCLKWFDCFNKFKNVSIVSLYSQRFHICFMLVFIGFPGNGIP